MDRGGRNAGASAVNQPRPDRPLRVLSISTLYPSPARPGFGLFVARQAQALAARGDVEIVVINPVQLLPPPFDMIFNRAERNLPPVAKVGGVEVHYPRFRTIPKLGARYNPWLIARAIMPLVKKLHAKRKFDVLDAQFFYPDGPAVHRIAKALGLPFSIKARGSDIHMWGIKPFSRKAMLAAAADAGGLLAVSEGLKVNMATMGMSPRKIFVHYTGLDRRQFHPRNKAEARAQLGDLVPQEGLLIASAGNLIPLKGHHIIIESLHSIPGAELVIAGTGPEEKNLRKRAEDLRVADRVTFAGSLKPDKLATLLAAADIFALASEREGLANVWIEALASGTPLVITGVGGAREVVTSEIAGRLISRDPSAVARGVRSLLDHPHTPEEIAATVDRFSWENNARELADHFRKIAAKG